MSYYVLWNGLTQSVDAGEDGDGWISWDAACAECGTGSPEQPAYYRAGQSLVFGKAACLAAERAQAAKQALAEEASSRRAALIASFAATTTGAPALPACAPDGRARRMLAANEAALAAEIAKGRRRGVPAHRWSRQANAGRQRSGIGR